MRGFTTRRRLSVDTRLGVGRILATPTQAGISCQVLAKVDKVNKVNKVDKVDKVDKVGQG